MGFTTAWSQYQDTDPLVILMHAMVAGNWRENLIPKQKVRQWDWWRARMLGGRTNHWGRISLRFGPKDFKRKSIDGLGRRLADRL